MTTFDSKRGRDGQFRFIWRIKNLLNERWYIGYSTLEEITPRFFTGHNKELDEAVEIYGLNDDTWRLGVLKWCLDEKELSEAKEEFITYSVSCNPMSYNTEFFSYRVRPKKPKKSRYVESEEASIEQKVNDITDFSNDEKEAILDFISKLGMTTFSEIKNAAPETNESDHIYSDARKFFRQFFTKEDRPELYTDKLSLQERVENKRLYNNWKAADYYERNKEKCKEKQREYMRQQRAKDPEAWKAAGREQYAKRKAENPWMNTKD